MFCRLQILILTMTAIFSSSAAVASVQRPAWSGWQLEIRNTECKLKNEFRVHPGNLQRNGGFLTGTTFTYVRLMIVAKTHTRDADRYRIGEAMLGVHIQSHIDLESADRISILELAGVQKTAVDFGERAPGDKMNERHAYFWFYGAAAESLIVRLTQGESLPLVFISRSGDRVVETVFAHRRYDRFPAWEAAFRGCALANLE